MHSVIETLRLHAEKFVFSLKIRTAALTLNFREYDASYLKCTWYRKVCTTNKSVAPTLKYDTRTIVSALNTCRIPANLYPCSKPLTGKQPVYLTEQNGRDTKTDPDNGCTRTMDRSTRRDRVQTYESIRSVDRNVRFVPTRIFTNQEQRVQTSNRLLNLFFIAVTL